MLCFWNWSWKGGVCVVILLCEMVCAPLPPAPHGCMRMKEKQTITVIMLVQWKQQMKFRITKKASSDYSLFYVVEALLLLCAPCWPWLCAHAHERKQKTEENNVSHPLKKTLRITIKETIHWLPFLTCAAPCFMTLLPFLYKMNQSPKTLFLILSVCLKLQFSNYCQLISDINR